MRVNQLDATDAAYLAAGRVPHGHEEEWMDRSLDEAIMLATKADAAVQSDDELE